MWLVIKYIKVIFKKDDMIKNSARIQKNSSAQYIIVLIAIFFITNSCRKIDHVTISDYATTSRFFQAKRNVKPAVNQIIEKIRNDDEKYHFVNQIVKNEGYAIRDKAILQLELTINSKESSKNDIENEDTVVLIPLVLANTEYVNSFYAVKLSDDISIKLFSGKDYKTYPYGKDWDTKMTADKVAAEIMNLERETFGHNYFIITDPKLFANDTIERDENVDTWAYSLAGPPGSGGCSLINIFINLLHH